MSYVEQARAVIRARKSGADSSHNGSSRYMAADEKNEENEKSRARLTPDDAASLKAEIIAAAMVPSSQFDRRRFERLWARWEALAVATDAQSPHP